MSSNGSVQSIEHGVAESIIGLQLTMAYGEAMFPNGPACFIDHGNACLPDLPVSPIVYGKAWPSDGQYYSTERAKIDCSYYISINCNKQISLTELKSSES